MDLMSGFTQVIFHSSANVPVLRDRLTRNVMSGKTTGNSLFSSAVGILSNSQNLLGDAIMISLISSPSIGLNSCSSGTILIGGIYSGRSSSASRILTILFKKWSANSSVNCCVSSWSGMGFVALLLVNFETNSNNFLESLPHSKI